MNQATAVIDTADWLLAVPLQAGGDSPDFSDTPLTVAFTPILGGDPIATASSDDGTLTFVPASGQVPAYFALDLRVADRAWRIPRPTAVKGDIKRHPDPNHPERVEWLGRVDLHVHPGSDSVALHTAAAYTPLLLGIQPYDGRIVTGALPLGPQGAPAYPSFDPVTDEGKALTIVNGVPAWA